MSDRMIDAATEGGVAVIAIMIAGVVLGALVKVILGFFAKQGTAFAERVDKTIERIDQMQRDERQAHTGEVHLLAERFTACAEAMRESTDVHRETLAELRRGKTG